MTHGDRSGIPRREPAGYRVEVTPVRIRTSIKDSGEPSGFSFLQVIGVNHEMLLSATVPDESVPAEVALAIERQAKLDRISDDYTRRSRL